ncbi:MAG: hypothetical protein JSV25_01925 [Spirochaetota bacterium]|nr:MAG: hypothetical protein JSV25_01925 [Spirochaetota bacterium]
MKKEIKLLLVIVFFISLALLMITCGEVDTYTNGGTWTHPSDVTDNISPDGQDASDMQVAMDDNGNAIIVWDQSDGINDQIFKSEYHSGQWTHPSGLTDNISPDVQFANAPQVAMDDNGNAIIVWEQYDESNYQIFKSEYRSEQ